MHSRNTIKNLSLFFFLLMVQYVSYSQNERALINMAINDRYIYAEPIKRIELDRWDVTSKTYGPLNELKEHVDSTVFFSIIENISKLDTALWRQQEFDSTIVVKYRKETLSVDSIMVERRSHNKKESKYFKHLIKKYNASPVDQRRVISFSRPVFDNSRNYAVMKYSVAKSGFGILIFHFVNGSWKELGPVIRGKY